MPTPLQLLGIIALQTQIAKMGLDLGATMDQVVEGVPELIGADGAVIELAEGDDMVYRAASGIARPQLGLRLGREGSLSGLCVRTGEIMRCDDSELDERVDREACRRVQLRSMIVVPLRHHGETVGVLKALSAVPEHFTNGHIQVLGLLAEVIAAAMYYSTQYNLHDLVHRATHDAMTGLANRALFMDRLQRLLSDPEPDPAPASILMVDMDGLKQINDHHGHRAGDAAITEFARRLSRHTRAGDTVARIGGDEFAVILTPRKTRHPTGTLVNRLQAQLSGPLEYQGLQLSLGASVGLAEFPTEGAEAEELLALADARMYAQKQERRQERWQERAPRA